MSNVIDFNANAPFDTEDIRRDPTLPPDVLAYHRTQREIELEIEIADLLNVISAQAIELHALKRRTG